MPKNTVVLKNATIVSDDRHLEGDLAIDEERISQVGGLASGQLEIDVDGAWVLPGMIDDQVHFREPGMEHKATIATESRAALAGGVTSYLEMPNCVPQTVNHDRLMAKHHRAQSTSMANYGFYLGATNDNIEEIRRVDRQLACGIKVFMGASTGNMLVDDIHALERIFSEAPLVIATHCEDTPTIEANEAAVRARYGSNPPPSMHAAIRSAEACYRSSSLAVGLAKQFDSRLHVLHLTSAKEMTLFETGPIEQKHITAEVCTHHLLFDDSDYDDKRALIKCNPSVKLRADRDALRQALKEDRIDVIATDHAPHTLQEKTAVPFMEAPAGLPLVEYALISSLEHTFTSGFTVEQIVQKTSHAPAKLFDIKDRGFLREGYYADLVVVQPDSPTKVATRPVLSKCGWTPFQDETFSSKLTHTFVNGILMYHDGNFLSEAKGKALEYNR